MNYDPDLCYCATCLAACPGRRALLIAERVKLARLFRIATAPDPTAPGPDGPVRTYEETGKLLGLHRQTVQQVEAKALRKLRRALQQQEVAA